MMLMVKLMMMTEMIIDDDNDDGNLGVGDTISLPSVNRLPRPVLT